MKDISKKELALAFIVGFVIGAIQSTANSYGITNILYYIIQGTIMGVVVLIWTWYILSMWRKKK